MLKEIALLFFKLGFTAFGGPAAHIAMMENEVVTRRKWMDRQHFLDLVGATNLIPGPNSTEMAIHCGYQRAGFAGLMVAGFSFILPAALLTGLLAFIYVEYSHIPQLEPLLFGIKPAVIIIMIDAIFKLGKKAWKGKVIGFIGAGVFALTLLGISEVVAILTGGIVGMLVLRMKDKFSLGATLSLAPIWAGLGIFSLPTIGASVGGISLTKLFFVFLKIGAVLFGSGYVLIAYLDGELVQSLGWLTSQQLIDAIAIGQFTPGPVLSTATFIGYQLNGFSGAVFATLGIFIPSFFFVAALNPLIPKLRQSQAASAFLDAVNIGAVAIMIAATLHLGLQVLLDWKAITIAIIAAFVFFRFKKVSSIYLVAGSALLGYALSFL